MKSDVVDAGTVSRCRGADCMMPAEDSHVQPSPSTSTVPAYHGHSGRCWVRECRVPEGVLKPARASGTVDS